LDNLGEKTIRIALL